MVYRRTHQVVKRLAARRNAILTAARDACADGGNQFLHGRRVELFFSYQFSAGDSQRQAGAGDCSRSRAAVGLQYVAIHPDGALAEFLKVDGGAHGAANEALDFLGTAALLAACGNVHTARTLELLHEVDEEQRHGSRWYMD